MGGGWWEVGQYSSIECAVEVLSRVAGDGILGSKGVAMVDRVALGIPQQGSGSSSKTRGQVKLLDICSSST